MPVGKTVLIEENMLEGYGYLDEIGIQTYLEKINSWLKDKVCDLSQFNDRVKGVLKNHSNQEFSEIFLNNKEMKFSNFLDLCCQEADIEPIWMLSLIQKEQSALFKTEPLPKRIQDKIVGFGNTENPNIKDNYVGFENEIFAATFRWRTYDTWSQIKNYQNTKIMLYDSQKELLQANYEKYIVASNMAEAKAFLYNPRQNGIANHSKLWNKIYDQCESFGLI